MTDLVVQHIAHLRAQLVAVPDGEPFFTQHLIGTINIPPQEGDRFTTYISHLSNWAQGYVYRKDPTAQALADELGKLLAARQPQTAPPQSSSPVKAEPEPTCGVCGGALGDPPTRECLALAQEQQQRARIAARAASQRLANAWTTGTWIAGPEGAAR